MELLHYDVFSWMELLDYDVFIWMELLNTRIPYLQYMASVWPLLCHDDFMLVSDNIMIENFATSGDVENNVKENDQSNL